MSSSSKPATMPELPPDTRGTAASFHAWCEDELRKRRSRDLELDQGRYARAARLVLHRLGVRFGEDLP